MRGSHIVQCPYHVLRVSKIQQHLNAMGIFVIVFAKQILPYLRHRSTALQNPQNKQLVGRTRHSLVKALPIIIQTVSYVNAGGSAIVHRQFSLSISMRKEKHRVGMFFLVSYRLH